MSDKMPVKFADGREFASLTDAAKAYGVSKILLYQRLEKWQPPFAPVKPPAPKTFYFRGKLYSGSKAAAAAHKMSVRDVRAEHKRLRQIAD